MRNSGGSWDSGLDKQECCAIGHRRCQCSAADSRVEGVVLPLNTVLQARRQQLLCRRRACDTCAT